MVALIPALQIIWFVVHFVTRWVQHLDLTQLELVTIAFASVNAVVYGFWFKKPLNVGVPVAIRLKRRLRRDELKINVEREHGVSILATINLSSTLKCFAAISVVEFDDFG